MILCSKLSFFEIVYQIVYQDQAKCLKTKSIFIYGENDLLILRRAYLAVRSSWTTVLIDFMRFH